jgi:hypothetical protein
MGGSGGDREKSTAAAARSQTAEVAIAAIATRTA